MNNNRRQAIKKLITVPLAAAGLAIASKAAAQQGEPLASLSMPTAPALYSAPPPLDTRTPREVWQDADNRLNAWLDGLINNNPNYLGNQRQVVNISGKSYLRLKERLLAKGIKPEELVMGGDTFLVIHGNLYTIAQWW